MFHALLKSLQVDSHDSHDPKLNLLHPLKFPRERTLKNDLVTDAGGLYMGDERNNTWITHLCKIIARNPKQQ